MVLDKESVKKLSFDELIKYITSTREENKWTWKEEDELLEVLAEKWNEYDAANGEDKETRIKKIKKQIKYSKNVLEIKMLNKELNNIYKKM
jgi:hypothetical protein